MKKHSLKAFSKVMTLLILCLSVPVLTNGEQKEGYTVKKGDTLWDISAEKLTDPFSWPKLWRLNPKIKNPDLIYPGQRLNIPEEVVLQKSKGEESENKEHSAEAKRVIIPQKVTPEKALKIQEKDIISREALIHSGYITEEVIKEGTVTGDPLNRNLLGRGDLVYIQTNQPAALKTKFYILSSPERIHHPATGKAIGTLVRIKGILETAGEDNGNEKAVVLESYEEVLVGDVLSTYFPIEIPEGPIAARRPAVSGTLVKVQDDKNVVGRGSIVYLDKGTGDGVAPGDLFTVVKGERPYNSIGAIQVVSTGNKFSIAVVEKSASEIKAGDSFKN